MSIWYDVNGWPVPPVVLLGCLVAEVIYFRGWWLFVSSALIKRSRSAMRAQASSLVFSATLQWDLWFWRGIFFVGAILAFLVASSAPLDTLSARYLWVHMIQHILLLTVVPPLFVASAPLLPWWLGLPRWGRRLLKTAISLTVRRVLYHTGEWLFQQPLVACLLFFLGIWIWHWPPLYDLALTNVAIHDWCEHTTFLLVSILFWSQVISSPPFFSRLHYLARLGCIGFAMLQNVALSIIVAFAQFPLYEPYAHFLGGLTALQDQQLGAGIMWTFGDLPFGVAFSILVYLWLGTQSDGLDSVQQTFQVEE